jgi:hypothetical protein
MGSTARTAGVVEARNKAIKAREALGIFRQRLADVLMEGKPHVEVYGELRCQE